MWNEDEQSPNQAPVAPTPIEKVVEDADLVTEPEDAEEGDEEEDEEDSED